MNKVYTVEVNNSTFVFSTEEKADAFNNKMRGMHCETCGPYEHVVDDADNSFVDVVVHHSNTTKNNYVYAHCKTGEVVAHKPYEYTSNVSVIYCVEYQENIFKTLNAVLDRYVHDFYPGGVRRRYDENGKEIPFI